MAAVVARCYEPMLLWGEGKALISLGAPQARSQAALAKDQAPDWTQACGARSGDQRNLVSQPLPNFAPEFPHCCKAGWNSTPHPLSSVCVLALTKHFNLGQSARQQRVCVSCQAAFLCLSTEQSLRPVRRHPGIHPIVPNQSDFKPLGPRTAPKSAAATVVTASDPKAVASSAARGATSSETAVVLAAAAPTATDLDAAEASTPTTRAAEAETETEEAAALPAMVAAMVAAMAATEENLAAITDAAPAAATPLIAAEVAAGTLPPTEGAPVTTDVRPET